MRVIIAVLMMILASVSAAAYTVEDTNNKGSMVKISEDIVVFLTFEDAIDEDLNNDGDTADYVVQYYDLGTEKTKSTEREATDFDLFDDMIALEDKSRMIWLYSTKTKDALRTTARGSQLSFRGKNIAFASDEKDSGDLNNDGDDSDMIIRYYNLNTEEITNTRALGANPVVLKDYIVFETKETYAEKDFNDDGDRDDTIIRAFDLDTGKILNTKTEGENPIGSEKPVVIITHKNKFWKLDLGKSKKTNLQIIGNNPSLHDDLLVYEKDKELFIYRLSTSMEKSLGINGTSPDLFFNNLAFADEENKIIILKGEDPDNDVVPDFADNCLEINNPNQNDDDKDGIGNGCDEEVQPEFTTVEPEFTTQAVVEPEFITQEPEVVAPQERAPLPEFEQEEKKVKGPLYWFLVAVALTVVGVIITIVIPRWMNRRKGFGF